MITPQCEDVSSDEPTIKEALSCDGGEGVGGGGLEGVGGSYAGNVLHRDSQRTLYQTTYVFHMAMLWFTASVLPKHNQCCPETVWCGRERSKSHYLSDEGCCEN